MSQPSFHELHDLIKDYIQPGFTNFRDSISTEERLLMTLRYLASGTSFQHIGYNYRVSHNDTGFIVSETCRVIWERLTPLCLPIPDRDTWERIADEYYRNFPNCVGSIDGTHQEIQFPKHAGSLYFNYKDYHSLVVQAVADANYNFVVLDIGDYGRNSDGSIFRESAFGQDFENNRLDLPPPKPLPNTDQELPFVFLADEAYPLRENLITPYARRQRDGLPLQANTENADNNNITSLGPIAHSGRHSIRAKEVRDGFRNYFMTSEGSVPWVTAKYAV
ncbi:hypothetical protein RRG08_062261 [Elysia crispata]|uniref:DDE Tnp4 domain-containing protein n=1 Tax=Elysia crispata TaxID=231223 RepID=A0AAE0YG15_9GAST|nr:hypothetical protein RRG08_062261 [Elysia crispata]